MGNAKKIICFGMEPDVINFCPCSKITPPSRIYYNPKVDFKDNPKIKGSITLPYKNFEYAYKKHQIPLFLLVSFQFQQFL